MTGGAALVDPLGGATGMAMPGWVIGLLGIGLGYPGQPHVLTRYMAAQSRRTLHRSAMMSTADSQLLIVSSAVARDFIDRFLNIGTRLSTATLERSLAWISRASVLLIGLLALILALGKVRVVFWFVLFARSGLGAAFGPPILLGLFWRRVNLWGAVAGVATGLSVTILWKISWGAAVERATGLDLYELVPAFAMSLLMTWLVSILTPAMRTVPVDIDCAED